MERAAYAVPTDVTFTDPSTKQFAGETPLYALRTERSLRHSLPRSSILPIQEPKRNLRIKCRLLYEEETTYPTYLPTYSLASQGNGKRETTTDARVSFSRYAGKIVVYIRRVRWYSEVWEWERRAACRMIAQTLQTKTR